MYSIIYSLIIRLTILCLVNFSSDAEPLIGTEKSEIGAINSFRSTYAALIINKYSQKEENFHLCTGALVSRTQVLTAASCIEKVPSVDYLEVIFGTTKTSSSRHRKFSVLSKFTYEDWCKPRRDCFFEKYTDDVCLLQLNTLDVEIAPALLAPINTYAYSPYPIPGTPVKLTGWGHTNHELRPMLASKGYVRILSREDCEDRVRRRIPSCLSDVVLPEQIVCAVADPPILAVEGDFGGPVVYGRDKSISAIVIQRCPMHHTYDIASEQVNLLLHLNYYKSFFYSALRL